MFNSKEYEFADITIFLGNKDVTGIRGIKYTEKIEREPLYAKGRHPHSIQSGNVSYEGEITLTQSELEVLTAAGNGSVLNLVTDAVITYGNASNGDTLITDKMIGMQFTESTKGMKQGEKFMETSLPFIALRKLNQIA
jgi:hypothetical protein